MNNMNFRQCVMRGVGMKKMLLIVLLMLSVGWVFAGEMTVGDGNGGQIVSPFAFESFRGWSKNIYTFEEIYDDGAGITESTGIYEISFSLNNWSFSNIILPDQDIYMRQTLQSYYSEDDIEYPNLSEYTKVYSGEVLVNRFVNSFTVNLDTQFQWVHENNMNLEIVWVDNGENPAEGKPVTSSNTVNDSDPAEYRCVYNLTLISTEQGLSDMRPNITLHYNLAKPGAVSLLYPDPDSDPIANIYSRRVTFKWEQGEGPTPIGYKLYLGKEGETLEYINTAYTTEITTSDLDYETTYNWKIVPFNSEGDSDDIANIGSFKITARLFNR